MSTIGSNIAALKSLHNLRLNEDGFAKATERLSSGKRLNAAGDDAAGAAIVNRMTSQIAGMNVAIRNAGDAISMAQVKGSKNNAIFLRFLSISGTHLGSILVQTDSKNAVQNRVQK